MLDITNKDPEIAAVLHHLDSVLGDGSLALMDHWKDDRTAVGIVNPNFPEMLAYVVYAISGLYEVVIEVLQPPGSDFPYKEVGILQCADLETVCWVVSDFLCVQSNYS